MAKLKISNELKIAVGELLYPIGSIYLSYNDIRPEISLGFGQWTQIEGRFIFAVGATTDERGEGRFYGLLSMGGEFAHQLTQGEMPSHIHQQLLHSNNYNQNHTIPENTAYANYFGGRDHPGFGWTAANTLPNSEHVNFGNTNSAGANWTHNNMPPFIAVMVWRRVE